MATSSKLFCPYCEEQYDKDGMCPNGQCWVDGHTEKYGAVKLEAYQKEFGGIIRAAQKKYSVLPSTDGSKQEI